MDTKKESELIVQMMLIQKQIEEKSENLTQEQRIEFLEQFVNKLQEIVDLLDRKEN